MVDSRIEGWVTEMSAGIARCAHPLEISVASFAGISIYRLVLVACLEEISSKVRAKLRHSHIGFIANSSTLALI